MLFYPFNYLTQRNSQNISIAAEKLKNRNLPVEQILDEEELMNDLKFSDTSQLVNHLTKEDMINILKYVVKEPESNDHKIGYKFPFNASELLSGENTYIIDKFFEDSNPEEEGDKYEEIDEEETNKRGDSHYTQNDDGSKGEKNDIKDEIDVNKIKVDVSSDGEVDAIVEKMQTITIEETTGARNMGELNEEKKMESAINSELLGEVTVSNAEVSDTFTKAGEENNTLTKVTEDNEKNTADADQFKPEENSFSPTPVHSNDKIIIPKYEVLDYFFSFLNNENDLNYVLAGYFAKIFGNLRYNRPAALTRYLFVYKREWVYKMTRHLNRKAIADTMLKVLTVDVNELLSDLQLDVEIQVKYQILDKIFNNFNSNDEEKSQNICEMLTEAINNRKFLIMLLKNMQIFQKLYLIIIKSLKYECGKELLRMANKLCEMILREIKTRLNKESDNNSCSINMGGDNFDKGFGYFDEGNSSKPTEAFEIKKSPYIIDALGTNLELLIEEYAKSESVEMPTTFDKNAKILGVKNLMIFEFVKNMLEIVYLSESENSQNSLPSNNNKIEYILKVLIDSRFMSKSINNFFQYEWNNSYQKSFESLFELLLKLPQSDDMLTHIFIDQKFIDRMIDSLPNRFYFSSGKFTNPGYLPFVLEISYLIATSVNENLKVMLNENSRWEKFYTKFVEPIRKRFSMNLKYELQQESLFCEEKTRYESDNSESYSVEETTEKNFIECIRKQATISLEETSSESTSEMQVEEFYDNNYWKSPNHNTHIEDILSDLTL